MFALTTYLRFGSRLYAVLLLVCVLASTLQTYRSIIAILALVLLISFAILPL
jgi:hypothetical protein